MNTNYTFRKFLYPKLLDNVVRSSLRNSAIHNTIYGISFAAIVFVTVVVVLLQTQCITVADKISIAAHWQGSL